MKLMAYRGERTFPTHSLRKTSGETGKKRKRREEKKERERERENEGSGDGRRGCVWLCIYFIIKALYRREKEGKE